VAPIHTNMCTSEDMSISGFAAAILDLSLPIRSDSIVGIAIELLDPKNIYMFSRLNCVAIMCTSGDMSNSGLAAAILDLSLPVRSDRIVGITV